MKPFLLLLIIPTLLFGQLTLEQAWIIALDNSPTEEIAQARLEAAKAQAGQARSAYHPFITATGSGTRIAYSDADSTRIPGGPETEERYEVGLQANWILWNSGKRGNEVEASDRNVAAFEAGLSDTREALLTQVGVAFTSAQLSRANLRIAEADVEFQERQLENSIRKEEAGLDSRTDRLNFEIRKLSAEAAAVQQRAGFTSAMATLSALLGVDPEADIEEPVRLQPGSSAFPETVPNGPEVWADLENVLPALIQAREQVAAAEASVKAVKGDYGPELSAFGRLVTAREDDPAFETDDLGNTVGLQVKWDIWTGGLRIEQVRLAEANLAEARAGARDVSLQAIAEVKRTVASYTASVEAEKLSAKTFDLSRENRDLVDAAYQAGRETLLRLNEAQRDFNNAGLRYAAAHLERQLAWIEYQRATGGLLKQLPDAP